jgi:NAD(P)-dependent dehydrogenase (short-subunit alcohol dehydrogenase family)
VIGILDKTLDLAVAPGYTSLGYRLRGLSWQSAVAGDLSGRAALVTGAGSGIGEAVSEGLVRAGARVYMIVRDRERGEQARMRILERLGRDAVQPDLRLAMCDLSELESVRALAAEFAENDLAVLVNNAGVLLDDRRFNSDGVELTFATNVLGGFALTEMLLPNLRAGEPGRVVNVSSGGMYTARLRGEDLQLEHHSFDGSRFYAHTKRAQVILTELLAQRERDGVLFASMHPGWVATPGLRTSMPRFFKATRPLLRDARQGADSIVWLATVSREETPTGLFWHDRRPRSTHRIPTTRETFGDRWRLWDHCTRLAFPGIAAPTPA